MYKRQTQTIDLMVQGKQKVDVLNLIPPQRASGIARRAGLANVGERWCGVDFLTYESTRHKGIHVPVSYTHLTLPTNYSV